MNRSDLVRKISDREGLPTFVVDQVVGSVMDIIADTLQSGEAVALRTFGKFEPRTRAAVTRLNPATREPIDVPEQKSVGFIPSRNLKDHLNAEPIGEPAV